MYVFWTYLKLPSLTPPSPSKPLFQQVSLLISWIFIYLILLIMCMCMHVCACACPLARVGVGSLHAMTYMWRSKHSLCVFSSNLLRQGLSHFWCPYAYSRLLFLIASRQPFASASNLVLGVLWLQMQIFVSLLIVKWNLEIELGPSRLCSMSFYTLRRLTTPTFIN